MHKNRKGVGARTAQLKIAKKPVYFALDQRLVRRHKTLLFLTGLGQAAAVLVVIISGLAPNMGNRAYAGSGAYSGPHGSNVFVMLVDTTKPGNTSDTQFRIDSSGDIGFNYSVDCDDDGSFEATGQTSEYICNYSTPGTYSVVIDGNFHRLFYNGHDEADKILEVQQWGDQVWSSFGSAFYGASNLQITATDAPNLTSVSDMSYMFSGASSMNANLNSWDVSHITNMEGMFRYASSFNGFIGAWNTANVTNFSFMFANTDFNQPIGVWDTSGATTMSHMFADDASFNQPIDSWDVSHVTTMYRMFWSADLFNQDLNSWVTGSVTNFEGMFGLGPIAFNGDISNWDTSSAYTMNSMFMGASSFNQPLNNWDVGSVINTVNMFNGATSFNQPLNNWDTTNIYNMEGMFSAASSFNQNINAWDTGGLTDARWLFQNATTFNQPLNSWDVSGVTNTYRMFAGASSFNQDISSWNTSNVTSMQDMFNGATSFNQPVSNWDVSGVTNMTGMFQSAYSFNQPLDGWDTSSVTSIGGMFLYAYTFNQDLGSWNTSNVTSMYHVFQYTQFNYDISSWDTSKVTTMRFMFQGTPFNQDISGWDTGLVTDFVNMFSGATAFNQNLSGWDVSSAIDMHGMFASALSFNQDISNWDISSVTNAEWMFDNSGISPETYDLILTGWSGQLLHSNVTLGASGKSYCTASVARQNIIGNFNWTINDAGQACMPEVSTGGVASVASDTATLEINIIDDGGGNVQDAGVQYGTDTNYGGTRSANSFGEGIQQVDLGSGNLQCETTYHYRAFIQNGAGTAHGEDKTFTTTECPPPPQPFDLRLRASLLNTAPVRTGDTANYQLKAKNLGPGATNSAIFYVNIPHETNYESATFNVPDSFDYQCYNQGPIQEVDGGGPLWSSYTGDLIVCQVHSDTGYINSGDELTMNLSLTATSNFQEGSSVLRGLLIAEDENESDMLTFFSAIQSGTPVFDVPINNIVNLTYGQGDSDRDGIYDNVENAAPNNGDANNDGTPDSAQANVSTFVSPINGKYVALAVDEQCEITDITLRPESANATQDKAYDYPNGLMDFTLDCGTPGYTATITQYYYGTKKDGFSVRKYNPSTKTYSNIDTASISESTIATQTVTQATYQIKDGSSLDLDGAEDGKIHDPAGLARKDWLAGTGQNLTLVLYASFALVTLGGSAYVLRRARRKSRPSYTTLR